METEIESVYAAGDIRVKQVRQVSTAVADGTIAKMETEIESVYAAGDIRVKQVRQVSTAVADGTIAAINCM